MAKPNLAWARPRISLIALLVGISVVGSLAGFAGRSWLAYRARSTLGELGAMLISPKKAFGVSDFDGLVCEWDMQQANDFRRLSKALGQTPSLVGLWIDASSQPIVFAELDSVPSLRGLRIDQCSDVSSLGQAAFLTRLEYLGILRSPAFSRSSCGLLSHCASLRHLDLSITWTDDEGLKLLPAGLKTLRIRDTRISPAAFGTLDRFARLETLDISRGPWLALLSRIEREPLSLSGLPGLDGGPFREFHRVDRQQLEPAIRRQHCVTEAGFPKSLSWLDLSGWAFSGEVLSQVAQLPKLEYVNISGQHIDSSLISDLSAMHQLRAIGLADCDLPQNVVALLGTSKSIESLDIRGHSLNTDELTVLAGISSLQRIYFDVEKGVGSVQIDNLTKVFTALKGRKLFIECAEPAAVKAINDLAVQCGHSACEVYWSF